MILSARRAVRLREVQAACAHPDRHVVLPLDLADTASLEAAARQALDAAGPIDVLINNGGVSQRALALDTKLAVDRRIMDVNYFGAMALTKAVLPPMLARGAGHLVVVTSVVGKFGSSCTVSLMRCAPRYTRPASASRWSAPALSGPTSRSMCSRATARRRARWTPASNAAWPWRSAPPGSCAPSNAKKTEVYFGGKEAMAVYLKRFWPGLFNRIIRRAKVT